MDMDAGTVIGIVISLVTAAVTVGVSLGKLGGIGERVKGLEKGAERQGERIGALEQYAAAERAVSRERRNTGVGLPAVPRHIKPEESEDGD